MPSSATYLVSRCWCILRGSIRVGRKVGELSHLELAAASRVRLANEASFRVGRLTVHPATRQLVFGDLHETIEPRVMQVLVALARARGNVVSRDQLTECCWEGRIVGEDAINRVLSRLRHIATGIGGGSFEVDTIRGVGYRLIERGRGSDAALRAGEPRTETARALLSRRTLIAASGATGIAAVAGTWFFLRARHEPLPLAMQYYRRGLETRGQASINLAEQGAALFREAVRIDPQFADAWGALAWSYRGLLEYGPRPDSARLESLCRSAAARALELDPDNADAHSALLLLKPFFGNWAEIEDGCRRLLERHPRNSILEYNLGHTLCDVGRWRATIPYFRAVAERERFWPLAHNQLARSLQNGGRSEEAEDIIEDGLKRFPRRKDYWLSKIGYLADAGRVPEALAFATDISSRPAVGIEPAIEFQIMILRALADGSTASREAAFQKVAAAARTMSAYLPMAALSASALGYLDASFSMLEGFYFGRGPWARGRNPRAFTSILFLGSAAPIRTDRRFSRLLRETGLEEYWRKMGVEPDYRRTS
ncbi:MAG TPA: winged helix-turn-helix domain-containing protein [Sphingomicrobium sp.]|nr:winged helix-turn-helix domain-containing protein [Sphingomicrobium sp.]